MALLDGQGMYQLAGLLSQLPTFSGRQNAVGGLGQAFLSMGQQAREDAMKKQKRQALMDMVGPQTSQVPALSQTGANMLSPRGIPLQKEVQTPGLLQGPQRKMFEGLLNAGYEDQALGMLNQGGSGAFEGNSIDAQIFNKMIDINQRMASGQPISSQDIDAYKLGYSRLSRPRTFTTPDGRMYEEPGMNLDGFYNPFGNGQPSQQGGGYSGDGRTQLGTKPKSGPEAQAISSAKSALDDLSKAKRIFFDNDGKLNRGSVVASNLPIVGGAPGTKGREARQQMRRSIETILRARSGAAVPPEEVDNYMDLYAPSPLDSDEAAAEKIRKLEQFFNGTLELMQAPGWEPGSAKQNGNKATDIKSKYGLE